MRSLLVLLVTAAGLAAQPAFEVASVKRVPPDKTGSTVLSPPGAASFSATHVTLELMVELAYGVNATQISGKPEWFDSEQYDITGKPEGPGGLTYAELRPMVQDLLARRFGLKVHRETKEVSGFALVVAKDGPKLKASTSEAGKKYILPSGIRFDHTTLATFAAALERPVGRPVTDKTGIEGNFDIDLKYAPEGASDSPLPAIFTALQEQLGLKLEPRKVAFELLVIDRADRAPTEN